MAKILTFRTVEMRRDEAGEECEHATAEVIVFPGIRYERWEDGSEESQPRSSAKKQTKDRRRDVLELAE